MGVNVILLYCYIVTLTADYNRNKGCPKRAPLITMRFYDTLIAGILPEAVGGGGVLEDTVGILLGRCAYLVGDGNHLSLGDGAVVVLDVDVAGSLSVVILHAL